MLTDPLVEAPLTRRSGRGAVIKVVKVVGGHDPFEAIGVGQVVASCHLVVVGLLVREDSAAIALVVMVVNEGQGMTAIRKAISIALEENMSVIYYETKKKSVRSVSL